MSASVRVGESPQPQAGGVISAALASAVLFALAPVIPILSIFAMVAPVPLIVQRLRRGLGSALLATLLASSVLAWAFSPGLALGFLLVLVVPGLLLGEAIARGRGLRRGCTWAFFFLAGQIVLGLIFAGPQVTPAALQVFDSFRSPEFLAELRTRIPAENVEEFAAQAKLVYSIMEVVYPAALVIMGALVVLANAGVLRYYLARRDPGWLDGGEFEGIRWPLGFVATFVVAGLGVVFPAVRPVSYNVLLIVGFFFALQGLAVTSYYARRLAGPPLLRGALMALVVLNPWAPQILALLGLFDTWFDFRKWAEPPQAEER
jgi:uncharacterized protein YybS (DUF2232 family)